MREQDLFQPLQSYLQAQGYSVSSEVRNCDIVAVKDEDLLIIEIKTIFSTSLLIQAARRKELCDSVYVAIPVSQGRKIPPKFSGIKLLCRNLEIGLILVRFLQKTTRVELVIHPEPFARKRRHKRRQAIIREIDGRYAEFNAGGSTSKDKKLSAYRQQALVVASLLENSTGLAPKDLKSLGAPFSAQRILAQNLYGWFDKVKRGVYTLNPAGYMALKTYEKELRIIKENL